MLRLAPFVDYGRAWQAQAETTEPKNLSSTGVGLIWDIMRGSRFEVYWGHRWTHVDSHSNNLQDRGVHLQLVVEAL